MQKILVNVAMMHIRKIYASKPVIKRSTFTEKIFVRLVSAWIYFHDCKFGNISCGFIFLDK